MTSFRATIRVRPAAHQDAVGGRAAALRPGDPSALEVRVRARPIDGAATAAAERVLASALGLRPRQVRVVRGATSRDKLVEITDPPADLAGPVGRPARRVNVGACTPPTRISGLPPIKDDTMSTH